MPSESKPHNKPSGSTDNWEVPLLVHIWRKHRNGWGRWFTDTNKIGHLIQMMTESHFLQRMPFDKHWDTYILTDYAYFHRLVSSIFPSCSIQLHYHPAKAPWTMNLCRSLSLFIFPSRQREQPNAPLECSARWKGFPFPLSHRAPMMLLCCSSPLLNDAHMSYGATRINSFPLPTAQRERYMRPKSVLRRNGNATRIIIVEAWATWWSKLLLNLTC